MNQSPSPNSGTYVNYIATTSDAAKVFNRSSAAPEADVPFVELTPKAAPIDESAPKPAPLGIRSHE